MARNLSLKTECRAARQMRITLDPHAAIVHHNGDRRSMSSEPESSRPLSGILAFAVTIREVLHHTLPYS